MKTIRTLFLTIGIILPWQGVLGRTNLEKTIKEEKSYLRSGIENVTGLATGIGVGTIIYYTLPLIEAVIKTTVGGYIEAYTKEKWKNDEFTQALAKGSGISTSEAVAKTAAPLIGSLIIYITNKTMDANGIPHNASAAHTTLWGLDKYDTYKNNPIVKELAQVIMKKTNETLNSQKKTDNNNSTNEKKE